MKNENQRLIEKLSVSKRDKQEEVASLMTDFQRQKEAIIEKAQKERLKRDD